MYIYIFFERENWTVIGRLQEKELQEFHREKHFVIEPTPWKIFAGYYQKLHRARVIRGIPWQSGVFPDLIYSTEFELHHYTEKICTEEQTLVPGNDVYTFSQIFKETNDRGIFENRIIFFQNIV